MRIALISTLCTPVRQTGSGSVEGLVWLLTHELAKLGHEITVFGIAGSEVDGEVVESLPGTYGSNGSPDEWQLCEWINLCRAIEQSERFDVMHSHSYLYGLPLEHLSKAPMVHTTHVMPEDDSARLRTMYPNACVTAISEFQWNAYPQFQQSAVIHHGVDATQFTFQPEPADYFVYLGRFTPGKGTLDAIATAKSLNMRLVLAGPRNDYFNKHIEPLVDGDLVQYTGRGIGGNERDQLLGNARALLYPIQEPEPFGLVMAEAMMCGTPVAAISLGAVGEIVDEGITGQIASHLDQFTEDVVMASNLDREQVRRRAEERFSSERMASDYLGLYERVSR